MIPWTIAYQIPCPWNYPGKNTGVGCHFLLQGIFPTQELNPRILCLLHWQVDCLPLAPPGKPSCLPTITYIQVLPKSGKQQGLPPWLQKMDSNLHGSKSVVNAGVSWLHSLIGLGQGAGQAWLPSPQSPSIVSGLITVINPFSCITREGSFSRLDLDCWSNKTSRRKMTHTASIEEVYEVMGSGFETWLGFDSWLRYWADVWAWTNPSLQLQCPVLWNGVKKTISVSKVHTKDRMRWCTYWTVLSVLTALIGAKLDNWL